ncbi:MAG: hypothetical protein ACK4FW_07340, partial [Stenotrophomonas sp.]
DAQALETLYLSAITVAELRAGVALMPKGRRRDKLHETIEREVLPSFAGRVLPFDAACTQAPLRRLSVAVGKTERVPDLPKGFSLCVSEQPKEQCHRE